jgi:polygalacturonase
VHFPAGIHLTGSIRLKSNLTLQFERGGALVRERGAAGGGRRGGASGEREF